MIEDIKPGDSDALAIEKRRVAAKAVSEIDQIKELFNFLVPYVYQLKDFPVLHEQAMQLNRDLDHLRNNALMAERELQNDLARKFPEGGHEYFVEEQDWFRGEKEFLLKCMDVAILCEKRGNGKATDIFCALASRKEKSLFNLLVDRVKVDQNCEVIPVGDKAA
jgi:hypothetical protein